jgi:uncharacterized OB-fold protein
VSVLLPQNGAITVPVPSVVSEAYWEGCRQHRLTYLHCTSCGAVQFNPAVLCRACNARTLEERLSEGRGAVYSWSLVWRGPTPAYTVPYAPAIVALNEGFHMISNIIGCEPDEVTTGLRVEVAFHELFDGTVLPYFTPEKERLDP